MATSTFDRPYYFLKMTDVFRSRKKANLVASGMRGYVVIRADEGGYRAVELVLIPPYRDQKPFEITAAERARLSDGLR